MTSTTKSSPFLADLRRAYRAEFAKSEDLQGEFLSAADYAAFRIGENPTLVRRMLENYEMIDA